MEQNANNSLTPLTPEDMMGMNLELDQIWYLKVPGVTEKVGPFSEEMLKQHVHSNAGFDPETLACTEANEDWVLIFDLPIFQRRRPQLASIPKTENKNQYYILVKGQKFGPHNHAEVMNKLKNKDLIYNDFVSPDKGMNWYKIFEMNEFDRRDSTEAVLPVAPSEETFGHSRVESLRVIEQNHESKEIIAMFANSGRIKVEDYSHEVPSDISHLPFYKSKKIMGGAVALAMTCSLAWVMMGKSPSKMNTEMNTEDAEVNVAEESFGTRPVLRRAISPSRRRPAGGIMSGQNHYAQPRSLNQISRAHNVPVPLGDAQSEVNYDDPPADFHDMADANEQKMNDPSKVQGGAPQDPNYAQGEEVQSAEPVEPQGERLPANEEYQPQEGDDGAGVPPIPSPARAQEEEIFNQESEG